jgi:hypothetical protein
MYTAKLEFAQNGLATYSEGTMSISCDVSNHIFATGIIT